MCAHQGVPLDGHCELRPDVAVLAARPGFGAGAPPATPLLVVEVVDGALAADATRRGLRYARAGVPEAWMVELDQAEVVVMRRPSHSGYRDLRRARPGETLGLPGLAGFTVNVNGLVGLPGRLASG